MDRHIKAPLAKFSEPETRFLHVNINLFGPLLSSPGCVYVPTLSVAGRRTYQFLVPLQKRRRRLSGSAGLIYVVFPLQ